VDSASVILMQYCTLTNATIEDNLDKISLLKLCSVGNNVSMVKELLDQYSSRILQILNSKYHEKAMSSLSKVSDSALIDLLSKVFESLIHILLEEISKPFSEMFTEKWENYDTNPIRIIGKKIDLFQKQNYLEPQWSKKFYEKFIEKFVLKYIFCLLTTEKFLIKEKYSDDESFIHKLNDDIDEIKLIFYDASHHVDDAIVNEVLLPISYLKSLIKDTMTITPDSIEDYPFTLSEFLGEYPQSWDVALIIVNKSPLPKEIKTKMKEFIDSDFDKIYKEGNDGNVDHIFRHFNKNYSVSKLREAEKKKKLENAKKIAKEVQPKKKKPVAIAIPKEEKKTPAVTPKEDKLGTVGLDDLDIDINDLDLDL
jgi:hypothetical protein